MVKIMYVEAKSKVPININTSVLDKLPLKLFLAYSIQYKDLAQTIKKYLGKKVKGFQQVLGCSKLKTKYPILLIGSGRFHALNLGMQNNVPIYIYTAGKIDKLSEQDLKKMKALRKAALMKFLSAQTIGILVSTKPGQEKMTSAKKLKRQLEEKGKKVYIFIANNLNLAELENFKIQSWVNTACPGLAFDSPKILNIDDISGF